MDHDHKELQFLNPTSSSSSPPVLTAPPPRRLLKFRSPPSSSIDSFEVGPSDLDLQLSICVRGAPRKRRPPRPAGFNRDPLSIEALRWHAAEQIQLAAAEKAYAEKVREMTRKEMELAQAEFNRANWVWERAREEVEKAELMKEKATRRVDSACMEITCHSCRHKFRPLNNIN